MMIKVYAYIAAGVMLVLALVALWWGLFERPKHLRLERDQARSEALGERGRADAGMETSRIIQSGVNRDARIDQETRDAVDAIAKVPEDRRDGAAIAALCLRDEYRNSPSCTTMRRLPP